MKIITTVLALLLVICLSTCSYPQDIKEPNVAGSFYPASKDELNKQIDKFLSDAQPRQVSGRIIALISPHAGYIYSGSVAAYGYKLIEGMPYSTVVIIAPSHKVRFDGISVYNKSGFFKTPLGLVEVDSELANKLIDKNKKIYYDERPFDAEHSLEVQIPFLQKVLKNFKIVPIIFGDNSYQSCETLADSLYEVLKDNQDFIVIASTDASHYYAYDKANKMDSFTIDQIKKMDARSLYEYMTIGDCELCGGSGVTATLMFCKKMGAASVELLKYANSGDTAGDKSRVVGYISAAVYIENKAKKDSGSAYAKEVEEKGDLMLTKDQKNKLLIMTRQTIEKYLTDGTVPRVEEKDPLLNRPMGAFVTLRKNGDLRGCIGNIVGRKPLWQTVQEMAVEAAVRDPRFNPVTKEELKDIDIEISVLSELVKISNADQIVMGKHGVVVRKGYRSGVFLPQVADETGWSREEFMCNLCEHKAGLPKDAWKGKDIEISTFTADVFGEKETGGKH